MTSDDLFPAYIAVIRYELGLPPGTDAVAELGDRLAPEDAGDAPPVSAPAIKRLTRVLERLREHVVPEDTLDQVTADLRFLRLFSHESMSRETLERMLPDVLSAGLAGTPPTSSGTPPRPSATPRRATRKRVRALKRPRGEPPVAR